MVRGATRPTVPQAGWLEETPSSLDCFEKGFEGANTAASCSSSFQKICYLQLFFSCDSLSYRLQNTHFSMRLPAACSPHGDLADVFGIEVLECSMVIGHRTHFD